MAYNKEAIGIILDVGANMNQAPPGEQTCLQTSVAAIKMILQRKLFAESKDEVALILFGTNETANDLAGDDTYQHIKVARPLGMVDWQLLQYLDNDVQPTQTTADFLDAIIVTLDHVMKSIQGKRGFASKRIILFSDLGGSFSDDQVKDIIGSFKEYEIELNVIGPDLDNKDDDDDDDEDAKPGTSHANGKEKSPQQRAGEKLLQHILSEVNGASYSFEEALPALSFFQTRQVRPTAWKCPLEIGPELTIPVAGYIKIKEAKAKTFKNVYAKDPDAEIERLRTHHMNDDEETEVDVSDTVEGHRYGSTLVPISEDDKDAMKLSTLGKCFKVLGFTKAENLKRHLFLGDYTMTVFSEKGDEAATVALSALIQALYETNMVAIVRRCYSAATAPRLGCLAPHIKANYECLFYNELPFAEDVRQFTFGSLPLTENAPPAMKKFQPTDNQLNAMDELIDSMNLCVKSEDDEVEEALKPKHTFNPYLQRLYQCLQHRALYPDDPLPELSAVIANSLKPPQEVSTCSEPVVEKMSKLFKLEEVAKKASAAGDNVFADVGTDNGPAAKVPKLDNDLTGGMADLAKGKVTEVGTVTPVDDFKAIISQKDQDRFDDACKMMEKRIEQLVMDSFGSQFYPKAIDCVKALREESIKNAEPRAFNDFLRRFKDSLKSKGRQDFWTHVVKGNITLISKNESEDSKVTLDEAKKFIAQAEPVKVVKNATPVEDQDDLLDQLE